MRFRSPENVVDEIEYCVNKYGIKEFNVFDDTFTLVEERAKKICDMLIERNLGIHWNAFSRVNTISRSLALKMKQAGCGKVSFGLESGSQRILNLMNKEATIKMARKAVETVDKCGILVHASFMFGNVGETEKTIRETINFAKSLPLDNATFFITSPYPGTPLYDVAKKNGFITDDTGWEEFAPLTDASPILVQSTVSKERLVYWQKRAFREFYIRPRYIAWKIGKIRSFGSIKMILEGLRILVRIFRKEH